ncbi:hypothetical protein G210_5978 [Candida maltosa Xu316]|uniref:ER transporter 6TM N-terminal domain-containing protein n=1 Tax=Candida maltosa (strain Xu316) TaxID=1245528 RepID=M3IWR0_CANMX|nr:hypothetical protein G210_5978 [Candida maltosa Xu316]
MSNDDQYSLTSLSSSSSSRISPRNSQVPIPLSNLKSTDNIQDQNNNNDDDDDDNQIANAYFPEGDERNILHTVVKEEVEKKPSLWHKFLDIVWPNYILEHLDYISFKTVCRSWVHVWSAAVLTIIPATSKWLGTAPYLILVMSFISISGGSSIIMNSLASVAGFFGFTIAFLHHVIASKIINDLHGGITSEELAQQLVQEGVCQMGDKLADCVQQQIFSGRYITTKGSAISALAIISNTFIVGNLRSHLHPLWSLVYVGGQISIVIFICYGQFSPVFEPLQLGYTIMKPMGFALALKIVSSFLVYPSTSNWLFFQTCMKLLTGLDKLQKSNNQLLATIKPSAANFANYKTFKSDISKIRSQMAGGEVTASTVWLEFSYGRFDVGDVGQIRSLIKNLISSTASFGYYYQLLQERTFYARDEFAIKRRRSTSASSHLAHGHAKLFSAIQDSYKNVGSYEAATRHKILKSRIAIHGDKRMSLNGIDRAATFIAKHFHPLLENATDATGIILEWMQAANDFRLYSLLPGQWSKHVQKRTELHEKVQTIKQTMEETIKRFEDVETMKELMTEDEKNDTELLFLISQGVLFLQIAKHQCENIMLILDFCLELDERRPTPSFITFFTKNKYSKPKHLSSDMDKPMPEYLASNIQPRNADSLPPANAFQVLGSYFIKLFKYFISNNFWFWIKAGGLIVIGAIPYFVRTTASWYYNRRMIWLVIILSLSISENTGSTIYVFCAKLAYTFFGAIVGMVGWYIASGSGKGNYYGYGAVTAVLFAYFVYFRHFSMHQSLLPQILFAVTAVLVMNTSWLDGQGDSSVDISYGYEPAYLRFIGVTIGLSIGSLAAIFPKPVSSKSIVRKILGKALSEVGNIHCDVTKFALKRQVDPKFHIEERHDVLIAKFRYLLLRVARLSSLLLPLKFELPIAGYWPESKYIRLMNLVQDVIQLYLMLLVAFNDIKDPQTWLPIILKRIGFSYSDLNAEIFAAIHMTSDSLKTKQALPKITEANVSVKHMEILRKQWGIDRISLSERFYKISEKKMVSDNGESIYNELDYEKLFSHDGQKDILCMLVTHMIYNRLDEIVIVVKGLVGEIYDLDENVLVEESEDESDQYDDREGEDVALLRDTVYR